MLQFGLFAEGRDCFESDGKMWGPASRFIKETNRNVPFNQWSQRKDAMTTETSARFKIQKAVMMKGSDSAEASAPFEIRVPIKSLIRPFRLSVAKRIKLKA